jgi:pimeloyl-ACP methyl ester carboxylesterase
MHNRRKAWDPPGSFFWHRADGIRQHVVDCGQGPTLLMLHGNPSWSFYWRRLIEACRDNYRCIAPDWIGMGHSDKPDDQHYQYTLSSRVDDLEQLYQHLVQERALEPNGLTLAVHDWGGMIGLAWAAQYPERISKLIITNTAAFPNPKGQTLPTALRLGRDSAVGAFLIRGLNAFAWGATHWGTEKPLSTWVRQQYTAPYDSWANRIAVLRFVQDIPLGPSDHAWSIVEQTSKHLGLLANKPTLIGWGMRDFVFDAAFYKQFCTYFPNAQKHIYDQAGHYLLEDAHEELIPIIRDFLLVAS